MASPEQDDLTERGAESDELAGSDEPRAARKPSGIATLEHEGEVAADYIEELLDICDVDGDLDLDVDGDRAIVAVVGENLDVLVGERGKVLDALQELARLAVLAQTGQRSRLMLDVAGYRAARRTELTTLGTDTANTVARSGEPARLSPMNAFERKVVHDAVAAITGVRSESEGDEPRRRVVVLPVVPD